MNSITDSDQETILKAAQILQNSKLGDAVVAKKPPRESLVTDFAATLESGNNWGPGRNLVLNRIWAKVIKVPANKVARVTFSFNAWYENAIIIYDEETNQLLAERGNGAYRHAQDWASDISPNVKGYIVTGWHKNGPANHRLPWIQSPNRIFIDTSHYVQIGFEDAGQDDYDDGLCGFKITDR
ncbi:MAG: hypothetical protein RI963_1687 [Planctomycetota bacterium]|jgi:hypothetical protein